MKDIKKMPKPDGVPWTDSQWEAISGTGTNMLVSAAAGSGKTAVLVERIIHKITQENNPLDVDRLLIVTFTKAAAAEMKTRIAKALEREIKTHPESLRLRRQLALLNRAQISTIHAFCMTVIKKYYFKADIDPQFRMIDDVEGELIREEILEEIFEEQYSQVNNESFLLAADCFSNDRNDEGFRNAVLDMYKYSRSHPNPAAWLNKMAASYTLRKNSSIEDLPWSKEILLDVQQKLESDLSLLREAKFICRMEEGPSAYYETVADDEKQMIELIDNNDSLEKIYYQMQAVSFGRLKTIKKDEDVNSELKEKVKDIRKRVKEDINKMKEDIFFQSPQEFSKDIKEMAGPIQTLVDTVHLFSERYQQKKLDNAQMDFSDLEHVCLQILSEGNSEAAIEYKHRFQEVLVDEFQDINHTQEVILRSVTEDGRSFFVGDVKQSIYRFRLAEPGIFLDKYKSFNRESGDPGFKIDLDRNFRSRAGVLDGVNFIFKQLMDERVGEIDYDEYAELKAGNIEYPPAQEEVEAVFINKGEAIHQHTEFEAESEEDTETAQLEARYIARKIKELIESKKQVYDKNLKQMRSIAYHDIVILMRSMPWANTFTEEFNKEGLPIYAELSEGYFEAVEINIMMALLKTIDNPYQDIPLAAVLRSPIIGMSEEELAQVRLMDKYGSFYSALKKAAEEGPVSSWQAKASDFYERLNRWRDRARSEVLSEFIWDILQETGYYDFAGGLPGGKQRQANLLALYDRARAYEKTSFRGLFRFLRFIERLQERGDDLGTARALGEQEDVIRLMTIHKSKGLEFPVVFISGVNKPFNVRGLNNRLLLHKELGIGIKTIYPKKRIIKESLPQLAVRNKLYREQIAEEMRALYVAMTRAKEQLILVGSLNNTEKTLKHWETFSPQSGLHLPVMERLKAKSFADWIGPCLFRHHSTENWSEHERSVGNDLLYHHPSRWHFSIIDHHMLKEAEAEEILPDENIKESIYNLKPVNITSGNPDSVWKRLNWQYPYEEATHQRSKQTVSEFKRQLQDDYSEPYQSFTFSSKYAERPIFLQEKNVSPAEKGTAIHTVLEHIPMNIYHSEENCEAFIEELVNKELLTKAQAQLIDANDIKLFFQSELGHRMKSALELYRELPFSYGRPVNNTEDKVLIQGTVDCIFRDVTGQLVLVDYKTDSYRSRYPGNKERAISMLRRRYQTQIDLYRQAVSSIWGEAIEEAYLYAFDDGSIIDM